MKADSIHSEKRLVENPHTGEIGIAEMKVWSIPRSVDYPKGRKFSLFLVVDGKVVIGIDNHRPKGPHLHLGERQSSYEYASDDKLLEDFWELVRKAGFEP